MNKNEKNLGSIILFIIVLLVIGVGGYFVINHINNKEENTSTKVEVKSIKKDDSKDFVYFINEQELSKINELKYKDIKINIDTNDASKVETDLNNNMNQIKNNVKKVSEVEIDTTNMNLEDDIYEAEMIDYDIIQTSSYLSINVNDYIYKLGEEATNSKLSYYVFDLSTGKLLSNRDILNKEGKTDLDVRTKIREYVKDDEDVDIDATLNQDYSLSISKNGKVVINTVVKTSTLNYNVSIEMD